MTYLCEIIHQNKITDSIFRMTLSAPDIVTQSKPGQFVQVRVRPGCNPLLRRPFSIHRINEKNGEIQLLYRVVGQGTRMMSEMKPGASLDLMGPLGNGFQLNTHFDHALIVAGGLGSAPIFFLIETLLKTGKRITLMWGASNGQEILNEDDFEKLGVNVHTATEDATKGHCGLVTDLLRLVLGNISPKEIYRGFVCGPECMIHEVQAMVMKEHCGWQALLEERMACGFGVCLGCAVRLKKKGFQMVCKDGPVFDIKELIFDD